MKLSYDVKYFPSHTMYNLFEPYEPVSMSNSFYVPDNDIFCPGHFHVLKVRNDTGSKNRWSGQGYWTHTN